MLHREVSELNSKAKGCSFVAPVVQNEDMRARLKCLFLASPMGVTDTVTRTIDACRLR